MENKRILITARSFGTFSDEPVKKLQQEGFEVVRISSDEAPIDFLNREIGNAIGLIAGLEPIDKTILEKAKKLKVISRYGVGFNSVDLGAATDLGIIVTNTPGANSDSVADLAITLMLSAARTICVADESIREKAQKRPSGLEMWGKTIGIIGTGQIGQGVAMRAKGFNMKIICYDMYPNKKFASEINAEYVDFATLIQESDFITIHAPLNDKTRNMIGEKEFKIMKKTAVIVNTARGGLIDEAALYNALKNHKIFAAGLDVTVEEPPYNSNLLELENIVLTPHLGATTGEASNNMSFMSVDNLLDAIDRGDCKYKVN